MVRVGNTLMRMSAPVAGHARCVLSRLSATFAPPFSTLSRFCSAMVRSPEIIETFSMLSAVDAKS